MYAVVSFSTLLTWDNVLRLLMKEKLQCPRAFYSGISLFLGFSDHLTRIFLAAV